LWDADCYLHVMSQEDFQNPIDPDKVSEKPGFLTYGHHVGSAIIKPEDQGKIKGLSLSAMEHQTDIQLRQIYEQMHLLAEQVKKLEDRKQVSVFIYQADIRFQPVINHVYHLYRKENGEHLLSMIAPNQWGRSGQALHFLATVQLLADHTWEIIEKGESWD
jgi:hypothetical protein